MSAATALNGATILSGSSKGARTLLNHLVGLGEAVIWIGGVGETEGAVASVGSPDDEAVWTLATAGARREHGRVARVLNLLTNPMPTGVLGAMSPAEFDAAMIATVVRTFTAMKATVPAMREDGGGQFLTFWQQQAEEEADGLLEPVCLGGLELCSRVIAKEYAASPTVNVNLVHCRRQEATAAITAFWSDYLGGAAGAYVTGANIGRPAH